MKTLSRDFVENIYRKNMTYEQVIEELKSIGVSKKEAVIHLAEIAVLDIVSAERIIKYNW